MRLTQIDKICEKYMNSDTSFKKLSEKDNLIIYYTNPAKANIKGDTEDILKLYDTALSIIGNKNWVWIFDSEGFNMKQAFEVQTGIGIAKLITNKYGNTLQEIKIINPTWHIKTMLASLKPFLNEATKQKIKILNDRYYSILEFI